MTPNVTFNNFQELYDYIYEFIITNHNNEIIAVQHNNIESGLLDFIVQAPRNSFKATIRSSSGTYTATVNECVLLFKSTATGSVTLTDNRWNEWVIINLTASNKQLIGAIPNYVMPTGIVRNYIPANSTVSIAKGNDNVWYQTSPVASSSPTDSTISARIQFQVDVADSYISNKIDETLIELPSAGDTSMVINVPNIKDDSLELFNDGGLAPRELTDVESYDVNYEDDKATINFYPSFRSPQTIVIRFEYS